DARAGGAGGGRAAHQPRAAAEVGRPRRGAEPVVRGPLRLGREDGAGRLPAAMSRRPSIATWLMLFAAAGAVGAACADIWVPQPKFCTTNAECDQGQICFPDGCGDPGRDLKAQITFASQSQEFEITDPELQDAAYDQEMSRPPLFTGLVRQDTPTGPVPFTNSVTLKASGSALLLAGVSRRVELGMQPLGGQYALPV